MKDVFTKRDPKAEKKHQADEMNRKDKEIRKLQADLRDANNNSNRQITILNDEISMFSDQTLLVIALVYASTYLVLYTLHVPRH